MVEAELLCRVEQEDEEEDEEKEQAAEEKREGGTRERGAAQGKDFTAEKQFVEAKGLMAGQREGDDKPISWHTKG